jgi:FKBP-type peptidyl-prolyl cis-trans isomerase 2
MKIGEVKNVKLSPEEAYGNVNPEAVQAVPQSSFPPDFKLQEGLLVQGHDPQGQPVMAKIDSVEQDSVVLDFNHPLAGKSLNFEIELLSISNKK